MSKRKIRMIIVVAGVIVCAVSAWLIVQYVQKKDAEEFARKCRSYVGVWESDDGQYEVTVRRVTGAHAILSLNNKKTNTSLESVTAHVINGDKYEFTYNLEQDIYAGVNIAKPGKEEKGNIEFLNSALRLEVPNVREDYEALDFQGIFKRKKAWREDAVHLLENMGTEHEVPEALRDCCVFEKGSTGKVERVRMYWEKTGEKLFYSDINGVNKLCFANDCRARFGNPDGEEELASGRKRYVYHDDTYEYVFIVNEDGLVVEGDCRYRELPDRKRDGDFLMQGDTVVRYLGDYEKKREVVLPEGTKRIARHAFTEEMLNDEVVCPFRLTIPKGVVVEEEAFAFCSQMELSFEEGISEIPERAFANMVQGKRALPLKGSWVTVTLPKSMKKLGKGAFYQNQIKIEEMQGISDDGQSGAIKYPITVWLNRGLEVIEEDALSGIILREYLPDSVRRVDRGVTLLLNTETASLSLPSHLEELGEDAIRVIDVVGVGFLEKIKFPDSLRKIGENAIYKADSDDIYSFLIDISVGKNNPYFKVNRKGWLTSKDEKTLYRRLTLEDEDSYLEIGKDIYIKGEDDTLNDYGYIEAEARIPEGTEEIRLDALRDIYKLLERYYNSEDYVDSEGDDSIEARVSFIFPKSLKRISRRTLSEIHQKKKFTGKIPEFTGTLDDKAFSQIEEIYVEKGQKEEFLQKLFEGQQSLTGTTKKKIRSKVKTY